MNKRAVKRRLNLQGENFLVSYRLKNLGDSLEAASRQKTTGLSAGSMGESKKIKTKIEESRKENESAMD